MIDETKVRGDGWTIRTQSGEGSPAGRTGFLITLSPPDPNSTFAMEDVRMLRAFAADEGEDVNELACSVIECSDRFTEIADKIERLISKTQGDNGYGSSTNI